MRLPIAGWKNKGGTSKRSCNCGSWKAHWVNGSGKSWPSSCSVADCKGVADVGAHIYNPDADGEWIAPFCTACNNNTAGVFTLMGVLHWFPRTKPKHAHSKNAWSANYHRKMVIATPKAK